MNHARVRYLSAKRSADARARSRRVADELFAALPDGPQIADVGAGTGTVLPWLLSGGVTAGRYHGIELSGRLVAHARRARPAELRRRGYDAVETDEGLVVEDLAAHFETGDALSTIRDGSYDLVVAQQFLDLVSLDAALDAFDAAVVDGGLIYCPFTFDGVTVFRPAHPADDAVERAYHDAIDSQPDRESQTGRCLIDEFRERPGTLLAVDAADAVVYPRDGAYPADERYFLDCLLGFVEESVSPETVPEIGDWLATRREQLRAGDLSYVGHRYDLLYRRPGGGQ